jgi:hypothetical protein
MTICILCSVCTVTVKPGICMVDEFSLFSKTCMVVGGAIVPLRTLGGHPLPIRTRRGRMRCLRSHQASTPVHLLRMCRSMRTYCVQRINMGRSGFGDLVQETLLLFWQALQQISKCTWCESEVGCYQVRNAVGVVEANCCQHRAVSRIESDRCELIDGIDVEGTNEYFPLRASEFVHGSSLFGSVSEFCCDVVCRDCVNIQEMTRIVVTAHIKQIWNMSRIVCTQWLWTLKNG